MPSTSKAHPCGRSRHLPFILGACSLILPSLMAWDRCGHEIVAVISYERLSAQVKATVDRVFTEDPRGRTYLDAATWPDEIKDDDPNDPASPVINKHWHFINLPYNASQVEITRLLTNGGATVDIHREKSANVVTAISYYASFLKSGQGSALEKADALSWLEHLVGDVHQPLHCVNVKASLPNYSLPPRGDAGGLGFLLHHPSRDLHALWDDAFDEPAGKHQDGRDASAAHARSVATVLLQQHHPTPDQLALDDPAAWALESYAYREFAYSLPEDPNSHAPSKSHFVTPEYLAELQQIAGSRLVLAGDRLAGLLEWIYGDRPQTRAQTE